MLKKIFIKEQPMSPTKTFVRLALAGAVTAAATMPTHEAQAAKPATGKVAKSAAGKAVKPSTDKDVDEGRALWAKVWNGSPEQAAADAETAKGRTARDEALSKLKARFPAAAASAASASAVPASAAKPRSQPNY